MYYACALCPNKNICESGNTVVLLAHEANKMTNEPKKCIFSKCTNQLRGNYACNLYQGRGCEPNKCDFFTANCGLSCG